MIVLEFISSINYPSTAKASSAIYQPRVKRAEEVRESARARRALLGGARRRRHAWR
ncbi:MAG TPA: hypothetical protein VL979_10515 [Solirubrobacteraceae bacterium]|nr:hypothetical protein [Solirubrobacteraceae bacterium]